MDRRSILAVAAGAGLSLFAARSGRAKAMAERGTRAGLVIRNGRIVPNSGIDMNRMGALAAGACSA